MVGIHLLSSLPLSKISVIVFVMKTEQEYILQFEQWDLAYYTLGKPEVTDSVYDAEKERFEEAYPNSVYLAKIGAGVNSDFPKAIIEVPMLSLRKAKNEDEFRKWAVPAATDSMFCFSEKLDGLSVCVVFWNGILRQVITRGDSLVGDDVTRNVRKIPFPQVLPVKATFTLRAEIFLRKSIFESKYKQLGEEPEGNRKYKFPRNAAVGILYDRESDNCADLSISFYNIFGGMVFQNEHQKFAYINKTLGLPVPAYSKAALEEVVKIHEEYEMGKRDELDYIIDGLVVTVDKLSRHEILGEINNRPRYARAFKFESAIGHTPLLDVYDQVGRTGVITPIGELEPIDIGGATIANPTLHNYAEIKRLGLKIGHIVEVKRAGDVIPKVTRSLTPNGPGKDIVPPKHCPACASKVEWRNDILFCPNSDCSARVTRTLTHWITKLEIMDFGEKLVEQLEERGLVKEPADFYTLSINDISGIDGRGPVIGKKVLDELHAKTRITLSTFICALGIPKVGDESAKELADGFHTLGAIQKASLDDLKKVLSGTVLPQAVFDGFQIRREMIANVLKHVQIIEAEKVNDALAGKVFCFTGFRDKGLEKKIQSYGGKIASSVTKAVTHLVVADDEPSTKRVKAESLGIQIAMVPEVEKLFL